MGWRERGNGFIMGWREVRWLEPVVRWWRSGDVGILREQVMELVWLVDDLSKVSDGHTSC